MSGKLRPQQGLNLAKKKKPLGLIPHFSNAFQIQSSSQTSLASFLLLKTCQNFYSSFKFNRSSFVNFQEGFIRQGPLRLLEGPFKV